MEIKKILNKWQYGISFSKAWERNDGWYRLYKWFLKFTSFPEDSEMITKKNYKGFLIILEFRTPIFKNKFVEGIILRKPKIHLSINR